MTSELLPTLKSGVAELGLDLSDTQLGQLMDYLALIQKWNKVYNLTAVRLPQEMLTHHLLDSLAVIQPLRQQLHTRVPAEGAGFRLLDVGAGAGLRGVVVAICCPEVAVTCVDTVAKKATFIQQVAIALKLPNLQGLHARVENLTGPFDVVSSRAFASLADFVSLTRRHTAPGEDLDAAIDTRAVFQQNFRQLDFGAMPLSHLRGDLSVAASYLIDPADPQRVVRIDADQPRDAVWAAVAHAVLGAAASPAGAARCTCRRPFSAP